MTVPSPASAGQPEVILLPVNDHTQPSATNPRKVFAPGPLEELAQSLQTHGLIQPIIVRRIDGHADRYEIIAGERRWRAAKLAKLAHVPAVVRQLTDLQVLEAQLIENGQREDIHPIEAADTFVALKKLDGSYTAKAIASRIGKSERYVQNVLHYAVLVPKAKTAFLQNEINAGHADLIARLNPADQERALKACFASLYGEDRERGVISVRSLNNWIENNIRLEVKKGAPELQQFPELQKAVEKAPDDTTLVQVTSQWGAHSGLPKGVLPHSEFRLVKPGEKCDHKERAVYVIGEDRGKLVDICRAKTSCKVHWKREVERAITPKKAAAGKKAGKKLSPAQKAADDKARAKRQAEAAAEDLRGKVLDAVLPRFKKVAPNKLSDALRPLIAEAVFQWNMPASTPSWKAIAIAAADQTLQDAGTDDERYNELAKIFKPLGLDFAVIEKELTPAPPAAAKNSPSTKAKAPARASLKKGARAGVRKALAPRKKIARKAGAKK